MWLVLCSHLRAGMLFMSAFDAIGSGEIGWKVVFGLSPAICAKIVPTDYRLTLTNVPQRRRLGLVLTKPSLILAFWRINFISVCFYFHTVCWDMLVALSASRNFIGPQNKTRAAVTEQCCCVCGLWSSVLSFTRYPRSVSRHAFKISCSCPPLCMSAPCDPSHASGRTRDTGSGCGKLFAFSHHLAPTVVSESLEISVSLFCHYSAATTAHTPSGWWGDGRVNTPTQTCITSCIYARRNGRCDNDSWNSSSRALWQPGSWVRGQVRDINGTLRGGGSKVTRFPAPDSIPHGY